MLDHFELLLFSTRPGFIREAVAAGVDGVIVDWERLGKEIRQAFSDTQINEDTLDDLKRVRACTQARVLCRINRFGAHSTLEIEQALAAGADEILLPMVQSPEEVRGALERIGGRCRLGILVETLAAIENAEALGQLPLSRVYVGLNDLGIERRTPNIFTALVDGTVEKIRPHFALPFGIGGMTLPERGDPIPCRLLIGELARLDCRFTFLRRSFCRDLEGRDMSVEIPRMRESLAQARGRTTAEVERDRMALAEAVGRWDGKRTPAAVTAV